MPETGQRAEPVEFDLHGYVGVRLIGADERDRATVVAQLGPLETELAREPDITVRFVDRLEHGPLTYVEWQECAFDQQFFYLLAGRDKAQAKTRIRFEDVGGRCEIVCEKGQRGVPLLLAIVNMTALAKGLLPLHASAFLYEGRGVLATGWAKGGKTEALLAFTGRGALYVGDEWVYLTPDGRMFGIPEPIRLWHWQISQLPRLAARLTRSEKVRLGVLNALARGAERLARRVRRGVTGSVLRRGAPVLRRQVSVQVPPARLFGTHAIAPEAKIDRVVFMSSHDRPALRLEPMEGDELARRVLASLEHERNLLLSYYRQFRFAFPDRVSDLLERAPAIESKLAEQALANRPVSWMRHPYPCQIDSLFAPISALLSSDQSRAL